jgi:hypothetical protein
VAARRACAEALKERLGAATGEAPKQIQDPRSVISFYFYDRHRRPPLRPRGPGCSVGSVDVNGASLRVGSRRRRVPRRPA